MAQVRTQEIRETLQKSAFQKNLVVLQLETEKVDKFEIVSGWISGKTIRGDKVALRLQNNHQQMRIIPITTIKKISTLPESKEDKTELFYTSECEEKPMQSI